MAAMMRRMVSVVAMLLLSVAPARAYLQCVPYAREVSGIQIFGDAHSWWKQAAGRYERGNRPKTGAVLAFRPHGAMRLGHVAAVSRVVDARTILVRHANWSPIGGVRGQIEDDVRVVDVSAAGDWSEVRVWYAPTGDLGTTRWPTHGFIYPDRAPPLQPLPRLAAVGADASPARRSLLDRSFAQRIERAASEEARSARLGYDIAADDAALSLGGRRIGG